MRVLLAANQTKVRRALRFFLKAQPGLLIVGETAEARFLFEQVEVTCPEVVLLDWDLPGCTPALLTKLYNHSLWVIVLSSRPEVQSIVLAAGADAFISKSDSPQQLQVVLQNVIKKKPKDL